tara:strand:+ start:536 stop:817 length:282 start_codon:yes stop_codon:yes gene_type:complete
MVLLIQNLLLQLVGIYSALIIIWAIGSWFPGFTVTKAYQFIDRLVFPYARLFRGIIPPLGGFDLSIIIALVVLQYLAPFIIVKVCSLFMFMGA